MELNKTIVFKYLTASDKTALAVPEFTVAAYNTTLNSTYPYYNKDHKSNPVSIYDNFLYTHLNMLAVSVQKSVYLIIKDALKLIEGSRYKRLKLSLTMQLVVIYSCIVSVLLGLDKILKPMILDPIDISVGFVV